MDLTTVVGELVRRLLADDWQRRESDDGELFYIVGLCKYEIDESGD